MLKGFWSNAWGDCERLHTVSTALLRAILGAVTSGRIDGR